MIHNSIPVFVCNKFLYIKIQEKEIHYFTLRRHDDNKTLGRQLGSVQIKFDQNKERIKFV